MDLSNSLTIWLAFIAGFISFVSPCVLPLVPAYIGYMGGRMTSSVARTTDGSSVQASTSVWGQRLFTFTHSLFFVAGFSFVFVTIGLLSTAFFRQIGGDNISALTDLIGRIGGVVIIFFGLHFMGVLPRWLARLRANQALIGNPLTGIGFAIVGTAIILWGFSGDVLIWNSPLWEFAIWGPMLGLIVAASFLIWLFLGGAFTSSAYFWQTSIDRLNNALYMDTRRDMGATASDSRGFGSSALMGVIFSAGWTPCIGPVYGAVLTMAANGGNVGQAGGLLAAYSLGLGIPFMLAALALDSAQSVLRRLQRDMHRIELASGAFLVLIGVLVASGQLQSLSQYFATGDFAVASFNFEESVIGSIIGDGTATPPASSSATVTPDAASSSEEAASPATGQTGAAQAMPNDSASADPTPSSDASAAIGSITALASTSGPSVGISIGNLAPDFETVSDSGQPVRLAEYRGQVVLLNFWATWCGPCRIEMPEFEAVFKQYQDDGLAVIAVNNAEGTDKVQGFRDELGLSFILAMDQSGDIQSHYNIFSYPSTFLLGRDGTILARHYGAITADGLQQLVDGALAT